MASAEHLEGLELCGQSESLTQRLRNILKDYSDGLAIPKEIIQNADDAGATKVTLIYDSRSNRQWQKSVLSGRMADCQGPSLWAHNNSEFTPEDFTNLLNLGGATKRSQSTKVGRFGLGFNSVYNLTDVPSVFSGWRLQFLDPHGETRGRGFLEDVYRRQGGNSTGVKLNFATKAGQQVLADFPHQFAPYAGVMGCASDLSAQPYRGTLIRLPLRTPQQAKESKICQQVYGEMEMRDLLGKTAEVAHLLLLFTQSVSALRLLHLRDGPKTAMLLEVKRSLIECLRPLPVTSDSGKLCDQTQVLTAAVHKMQQESAEKLIGQLRLRIETWYSVKVAKRLGIDALTVDTNRKDDWLQSTAIGFSDSLEMSQHNEVFRPPLASVAVRIKTSQDVSAADVVKPGVAFSFLPLPVETPLLFHVNATFAVTSSRRHLEETTMDESNGRWHPGRWNAALLREAACTALVAAIQRMTSDGIVGTPDLWPLPEAASGSIWCHLVDSFYQTVFSADPEAPCVFPTNAGWKNLSKAVFLDELSLGSSALGSAAETVRRIAQSMVPESWGVAEGLAPGVQRSAVQLDLLGTRLWEGEYFVATFLRNLSRLWNFSDVDRKHCCELLHLLLRSLSQTAVSTEDPFRFLRYLSVQRLLNSCSFVPNQLGQLCPAKELLDPCCSAAALYDQNDSIFPRNDFQIADIRRALLKFGLKSQIDFDELLKRAESIYTLDNDLRKERVRSLMRCICESKQLMTPCDDRLAKLRLVEFLPALQKPKDCKLLWYSESNAQGKLFSPRALYDSSLEKLVSLCQPVFDKSLLQDVPQDYKEPLLRMIGVQKTVTWDVAWTQLCRAAEVFHEDSRLICLAVYQHLSKLIDEDPTIASKVRSAFKTCESPAILFSDHGFLNPQKVSLNLADKECQPYLFHLLTDIRRSLSNYRSFLKAVGVLEQFGAATYCQVLKEMQAKYNGSELTDADRKCSIDLLTRLSELSSEKIPERSEIFAPDNKGVLTQCSDLCFGSIKWLPNSKSLHFVHKDVAYGVCEKLRIPDKREQALKMHHTPLPFGQKEELTTRIKGILKSYPLGIEIFKELVQNADDAGATRIHLINDRRSFLQERVLGEEWKSLQGPALLVVNDTTFSDDDIEGIQNLGVGSKGSHPWKTGQYGIGFNCVYHVTDVPMFLSDNRVLCVMDPHCRYMPNATIESPGGMYKDESLKAIMTDFPHFFEVFELKFESLLGSTVFRLPLRTQDMARKSKICSNSGSVNSERISALFEELKSDLTDILLFLTNVRTITLSELAPDGKLTKVAEVTSEISGEDSAYSQFKQECKKLGTVLQQRQGFDRIFMGGSSFVTHETTVTVSETKPLSKFASLRKCTWMVAQQLGFSSAASRELQSKSLANLRSAIASGMWKALPKVGVAARIDKSPDSGRQRHRAFNLLPLPLITSLPVHVNGHFALDPSRRNLWEAHSNDAASEWNDVLVTTALPECYVKLLDSLRKRIKAVTDDSQDLSLPLFYKLFPRANEADKSPWGNLTTKFYNEVLTKQWKLFPVMVRQQIEWLPLALSSDSVDGKAAFLQEGAPGEVCDVLVKINLPLVLKGRDFFPCLRQSDIKYIPVLEQCVIVNFLKGNCCKNLLKSLPMHVEHSVFASESAVITLLKYLLRDALTEKADSLFNLFEAPINLTADGKLRLFDRDQPVFLTEYVRLFPEQNSILLRRFAHKKVLEIFHPQLLYGKFGSDHSPVAYETGIYKKFSLEDFCRCLEEFLPNCVSPRSAFISLSSIESRMGDLKPIDWLRDVWCFIEDACRQASSSRQSTGADDVLEPVWDFALVPTCLSWGNEMASEKCDSLFQVSKLSCVYLKSGRCLSDTGRSIEESLQQLKAPALAVHNKFLKDLASQLKKPDTMLSVIRFALTENAAKPSNLPSADMATSICRFIQDNQSAIIQVLKQQGFVKATRNLPIFVSLSGNCTKIGGLRAIVIPASFEAAEIHLWSCSEKCVFIKENPELEKLYESVRCKKLSDYAVYAEFVLPVFDSFSDRTKRLHLEKLKILSWSFLGLSRRNPNESKIFLNALQRAKIVPNRNSWERAANIYHKGVAIFSQFIPEDGFLPKEFCNEEWLDLMKLAGLVTECTVELVLKFANSTASLPVEDAKEKADSILKVVAKADFGPRKEEFLKYLSKIPFIVPDFEPDLNQLFPYANPKVCSIENMVARQARFICWSATPTSPAIITELKCFDKYLKKSPSSAEFWSHVKNILRSSQFLDKFAPHSSLNKTRTKVMDKVYAFMKSLLHLEESRRHFTELKDIPCILADEFQRLVKPMQITLAESSDAIPPFLFACPSRFRKHGEVFSRLGVSHQLTVQHVAMVLEQIKLEQTKSCYPAKLNLELTTRGIHLLLKMLEQSHTLPAAISLYLPTSAADSRGYQLVDARNLVINDVEEYFKRLKDSKTMNVQFLDLEFCKISSDQRKLLEKRLSEDLKVPKLSLLVSEEMEESPKCLHSKNGCFTCTYISDKFGSSEFRKGLTSVIVHGMTTREDEKTFATIGSLFDTLQIDCRQQLHTVLLIQGKRISESKREKSFVFKGDVLYAKYFNELPVSDDLDFKNCELSGAALSLLRPKFHIDACHYNAIEDLVRLKSYDNVAKILEKHNIRAVSFHVTAEACDVQREDSHRQSETTVLSKKLANSIVASTELAVSIDSRDLESQSLSACSQEPSYSHLGSRHNLRRRTRDVKESEMLSNELSTQCDASNEFLSPRQRTGQQKARRGRSRTAGSSTGAELEDWSGLQFQQLNSLPSDDEWEKLSRSTSKTRRSRRSLRSSSRGRENYGVFGGAVFGGSTADLSDHIAPSPGAARRYLQTAQLDAEVSAAAATRDYCDCWACYQSWQAAEKALTAILLAHGRPAARSHSLVSHLELIDEPLHESLKPLVDRLCRVLNRDPRYPQNGMTPYEAFKQNDAQEASKAAASIVRLAEAEIRKLL